MPIELRDLTSEERIALVALVEWVAQSNTTMSEEEAERVSAIASAVGDEAYQAAADQVAERFEDEEALREFLPRIERQEARELIYGTVLSEAMVDVVDPREGGFLEWLARAWNVSTRIEEPEQ
ncbi:MAG TPA: hypothetical protein VEB21_11870 [Terriglobales bacterium]|nr:hypothetical protein [Terriglobales bacterium]